MGKIRMGIAAGLAAILALFTGACSGQQAKTRSQAELEDRGFTNPRPARGPEEAQLNADTKVYWADAGTCRFTFTLTKDGDVMVNVGNGAKPAANIALLKASAQKWGIQSCFQPQPTKS